MLIIWCSPNTRGLGFGKMDCFILFSAFVSTKKKKKRISHYIDSKLLFSANRSYIAFISDSSQEL